MQVHLAYVLAIHITLNFADGRSLRVKRQDSVGSPVYSTLFDRLWKQILPQYGTGTAGFGNWMDEESNSSETFVFDPTSTPSISPSTMMQNDVVVGSVSEEESMNDAISGQNQTEILEECRKIRVKDLREICIRVATNPILKKMSGVRAYAASQPRYTTSRGIAFRNNPGITQEICDNKRKCPTYNPNDINSGVRSLSPWEMCHEFDGNRYVRNTSCISHSHITCFIDEKGPRTRPLATSTACLVE